MKNIKVPEMLLQILHRFVGMVKCFAMGVPGNIAFAQRLREERDLARGCSGVTWSKERDLVSLGHLLLHKLKNYMLGAAIIVRGHRNPRGSDVCNSHLLPALSSNSHSKKVYLLHTKHIKEKGHKMPFISFVEIIPAIHTHSQ